MGGSRGHWATHIQRAKRQVRNRKGEWVNHPTEREAKRMKDWYLQPWHARHSRLSTHWRCGQLCLCPLKPHLLAQRHHKSKHADSTTNHIRWPNVLTNQNMLIPLCEDVRIPAVTDGWLETMHRPSWFYNVRNPAAIDSWFGMMLRTCWFHSVRFPAVTPYWLGWPKDMLIPQCEDPSCYTLLNTIKEQADSRMSGCEDSSFFRQPII